MEGIARENGEEEEGKGERGNGRDCRKENRKGRMKEVGRGNGRKWRRRKNMK